MPKPLSMDMRERIAKAVDGGLSRHAVATQFLVAPSTVIKLMQARALTGSLKPKKTGDHRTAILAPHAETVKAPVTETPDATLAELGAALRRKKIKVSRSALAVFLSRLRLTVKKTLHASEQGRPDVAEARKALAADQPSMAAGKLVFIDETGVTTNMVRRHGRAPAAH
jgi:transposase